MDGIIYFKYINNDITHTMVFDGASNQASAIAFVNKLTARKAIEFVKISGWFGRDFENRINHDNRVLFVGQH